MLPDYIAKASPNPPQNRGPWYANTAPSYAGVFLWIAFYISMAENTINHASLGLCIVALAVAGKAGCGLSLRCFCVSPGQRPIRRYLHHGNSTAIGEEQTTCRELQKKQ